jgi:hypothetical protein
MTADYAQQITEKLLRHFGIIGWRVKVVPVIPENPRWLGLCSYRRRTIFLAEHSLADDREAHATIYEELAHVMTEGDGHGPRFKETFERIAYWTVYPSSFRN